jgi:hypothetical protein
VPSRDRSLLSLQAAWARRVYQPSLGDISAWSLDIIVTRVCASCLCIDFSRFRRTRVCVGKRSLHLDRNFEIDTWDKAKPLRKLKRRGYNLARLLFVDDSPEKHTRNYGNLVQIAPFRGNQDDDELAVLVRYLKQLSTEQDVRAIEKRQWRERMEARE